MKNNKLFSVLLALLVCLSMVVSASATTETDLSFTLESDSSVEALGGIVVGADETFTVNVNIASNPGVLAAVTYVEFDSTVLELVSAKSAAEGVTVPESTVAGRVTVVVGNTNAVFTPDKYETVNATGIVAELTFKVLAKTDVKSALNLKASQSNVIDANGKFGNVTVSGEELVLNVVSAEHVCDETKTVEANNAVEPTCTTAGKKTDLLCAHCGKLVTEGEEIAALGHTAGDVVVENVVDATCTVNGSYDNVVYCTVCGGEVSRETVTVPATEHAWDEGVITTEPGCSTMGVRTYTCSKCGETKLDEHVPATGAHTYGDWTVKTEPTTEAEGVEARTCTQCGAEETRSIAKLIEEPAPKGNALVIVIIVVAVLAGAGVAAYFVLKNKKK